MRCCRRSFGGSTSLLLALRGVPRDACLHPTTPTILGSSKAFTMILWWQLFEWASSCCPLRTRSCFVRMKGSNTVPCFPRRQHSAVLLTMTPPSFTLFIDDATRPPSVKDLRPPTFSRRHIAITLNRSHGTNLPATTSTEVRRWKWCRRETKWSGLPTRLRRRTVEQRRH